jgi:hypothetical protein
VESDDARMLRLSRSRWVSLVSNLLLLAVVLLSWGYVLYAGKAGWHLAFFIFLYSVLSECLSSPIFSTENPFLSTTKTTTDKMMKKILLLSSFLKQQLFIKCRYVTTTQLLMLNACSISVDPLDCKSYHIYSKK